MLQKWLQKENLAGIPVSRKIDFGQGKLTLPQITLSSQSRCFYRIIGFHKLDNPT